MTKNTAIQELLRAASSALSKSSCNIAKLDPLLSQRNGFYAFKQALHVFPCDKDQGFIDIASWNDPDVWVGSYEGYADGMLFFAEDVFGCQFGINDNGIYTFDPETADREWFATDCEAWAAKLLSDWNLYTGYSLASEWQTENGPLESGYRLVPKIPFVLNGDFASSNLYAMESSAAMKLRSSIAAQIRGKADGTKVTFRAS